MYACALDRTSLQGSVVMERSAMTDADVPVLNYARFGPNGKIVGVDRTAEQVVVLNDDLSFDRNIGRAGQGPGEYGTPMAAVMDEHGRVFVADQGSIGSIIAYGKDGTFLSENRLPPYLTPVDLAADGDLVYLAGSVTFLFGPTSPRPVLVGYDPATGESEVLLRQMPEWFGRPPVYENPLVTLIPRVGPSGELYVGFVEGYEIWKVTGPDQYEVVVRGCVPDRALAAYRGDDAPRIEELPPGVRLPTTGVRRSFQLLRDFVVLPGGRILVRSGLFVDGSGRRSLELFSSDGELMAAWALGPANALSGWPTMNPYDPAEHLDWAPFEGVTRLVRFPALTGRSVSLLPDPRVQRPFSRRLTFARTAVGLLATMVLLWMAGRLLRRWVVS